MLTKQLSHIKKNLEPFTIITGYTNYLSQHQEEAVTTRLLDTFKSSGTKAFPEYMHMQPRLQRHHSPVGNLFIRKLQYSAYTGNIEELKKP